MATQKTSAKSSKSKSDKGATPFIAQYLEIKSQTPDCMLFFRMGDFYELFFEDAVKAAEILGITLTARGSYDGKPIPMAGVPHHSSDSYLDRLVKSGCRVSICEQVESPAEAKKRGYKSIVKREIVRVVTPGTLTEDTLLPAKHGQALIAIAYDKKRKCVGLASCDVSTGMFETVACTEENFGDYLTAWPGKELLRPDEGLPEIVRKHLGNMDIPQTLRPERLAKADQGRSQLETVFDVKTTESLGAFETGELAAIGLLLEYVTLTQAGAPARLRPPSRLGAETALRIDPSTRANLEIERTLSGRRNGALLDTVDASLTGPGARLLAERLSRPSRDLVEIGARLDAVELFKSEMQICEAVRSHLRKIPDIERARTRILLSRGSPKDLAILASGVGGGQAAAATILANHPTPPAQIAAACAALDLSAKVTLAKLCRDVEIGISDPAPGHLRDTGYIAHGYDEALDEACELRDDAKRVIANLQAEYAAQTDLPTLKIKHNGVLGYFIEVASRFADKLLAEPFSSTFTHRQTMASVVRFSTAELAKLAERISHAEDLAKRRERELFDDLITRAIALSAPIEDAAQAIAILDVAAANAIWAEEVEAVRPHFADHPIFEAEALRHPVVEAALSKDGKGYTPNNLTLCAGGQAHPRLTLITGPNMSGKSTYLRAATLAIIMAQAGLFVPARSLKMGLADQVFSRVGASDDLARGQSTFMVEMVETANILRNATAASFVILDEVGRGTSTWDGLSIAWACVEYLHDRNACRTLFATHYHELTQLVETLPGATNASLQAKEWGKELIFLHEVQPGPANRSYGVEVARLAGLPLAAVKRAGEVLKRLESEPNAAEHLPLFARTLPMEEEIATPAEPSEVEEKLRAIDPDSLTPRAALDLIYALRAELDDTE